MFDDKKVFCESIKTNQNAYCALSKVRYANFAIWLGDGGSKQISGDLPAYTVFKVSTGEQVTQGTLKEIGQDESSGDFAYRIDLSEVPEGGPYKISVKGYGCSYPFGVGGDFSRRLAHISFRSLYYQRCGCPIKEPYAWNIKLKPCHTIIYDTNAPIGEARIVVEGNEPTFTAYGGYHDAGDADRRTYHMDVTATLLTTYEAFPDLFTDDQYNIPDKFDENFNIVGKGNRIPDIIDEAEWGAMFDAVSQLMDYNQGLNPLGKCYVCGIGFNRVHNPHDRESAYTIEQGWGPRPGILVFGPGGRGRGTSVPEVRSLARERQYIDNLPSIQWNEFTIYQSLCFPAAVYPVLAQGGKWVDTNDPFATQQK